MNNILQKFKTDYFEISENHVLVFTRRSGIALGTASESYWVATNSSDHLSND